MFDRRIFLFTALAATAIWGSPTFAGGATLLTVNGLGEPISYSRTDLEALGTVRFDTSTIWTEGVQSFTGVPLKNLLNSLEIDEGILLASAVNDYTIEFPVEDALKDGPIIAFLRNGEEMSVRDKGPLWIIYPYDQDPAYRSEVVYSRSIWQLDRIAVQR